MQSIMRSSSACRLRQDLALKPLLKMSSVSTSSSELWMEAATRPFRVTTPSSSTYLEDTHHFGTPCANVFITLFHSGLTFNPNIT